MTRPRSTLIGTVLVAGLFAACAAPAPTAAPNAVVHFRSLVGNALLVGVSTGDTQLADALEPCGGQVAIVVPPPSGEDARVMMGALLDTTGAFDVELAQAPPGSLDADQLLRRYWPGGAIIWSTGQIGIDDLPRWITFRPGTTDISATQPNDTPPAHCEPWPPLE